jgi:hypothetical protein
VGNVTLFGVGEYGVTEIAINRSEWSVRGKFFSVLNVASPRTGHVITRGSLSYLQYLPQNITYLSPDDFLQFKEITCPEKEYIPTNSRLIMDSGIAAPHAG